LSVVLDQPATPEFICTKLVRYFVTDDEDLPPELIAPLAKRFRDEGLVTAPVLEMIFSSQLFYSEASVARKVRSPVELGIGLLRSLDATANMVQLANQMRELGQLVFYPPNVKGWAGGKAWINSSTLLGRANLVRSVVENPQTRFGDTTLDDYLQRYNLKSGRDVVQFLDELLLPVPLSEPIRAQLAGRLDAAGPNRPQVLKQVVHLLGSQPEFQLA
jgi:uncharacterized protein (DUF1800 family)